MVATTTAMTPKARAAVRAVSVAMMIMGGLAIILPFYVGIAAAMVVGIAIALTGVFGLAVSRRIKRAGYKTLSEVLYWGYLIFGVIILFMPKLTLGLAAFALGAFFILIGWVNWRSANHAANAGKAKLKSGFSVALGILIVLAGSTGVAWLIGIGFGVSLLLQGINLWNKVGQTPVMFEAES
ncbi:DUF308 domain-containing protein [Corallincola platygyrae]|uniref:DUF308 domain-containing protein n=1 Tax=Corallincola platygyrae TaxID=1193278 RepID=A0ABW4XR58_9GAMM